MTSENSRNILITGGLGFIGSNLIRKLLLDTSHKIFNLDFDGYASSNDAFLDLISKKDAFLKRYKYFNVDLSEYNKVEKVLNDINPDAIFHLAAESHVDRSIDDPNPFIKSNILGTYNLLEASRTFFHNLSSKRKNDFKFLHISTDEVFGSLDAVGLFDETSNYDPRSPYSASKACSDHLVKAWFHTYGLPTIICNCSNNYGPWQFPEKFIPNIVFKALNDEFIPIYGDGKNVRDWLFVEDHVDALISIFLKGSPGSSFCIGGNNEKTNIELALYICNYLDEINPREKKYSNLIKFVDDRPGHDKRYGIDSTKIKTLLDWEEKYSFEKGIKKTINWYLKNKFWCQKMLNKSKYKGERLGLV